MPSLTSTCLSCVRKPFICSPITRDFYSHRALLTKTLCSPAFPWLPLELNLQLGNANAPGERVPEKLRLIKELTSSLHAHHPSLPLPFTTVFPSLPTAVQYIFSHMGGKHAFMDISLLNKKHVRKTACKPSAVPAMRKSFSREVLQAHLEQVTSIVLWFPSCEHKASFHLFLTSGFSNSKLSLVQDAMQTISFLISFMYSQLKFKLGICVSMLE